MFVLAGESENRDDYINGGDVKSQYAIRRWLDTGKFSPKHDNYLHVRVVNAPEYGSLVDGDGQEELVIQDGQTWQRLDDDSQLADVFSVK